MNPAGAATSAPPGSPGSSGGGGGSLQPPGSRGDGLLGGRFGVGPTQQASGYAGSTAGSTGLGPSYGGAFEPLGHPIAHAAAVQQAGLLREPQRGLGLSAGGPGMPLGLDGPPPFGLPSAYPPAGDPFEGYEQQHHPAYGMMTGLQRFGERRPARWLSASPLAATPRPTPDSFSGRLFF